MVYKQEMYTSLDDVVWLVCAHTLAVKKKFPTSFRFVRGKRRFVVCPPFRFVSFRAVPFRFVLNFSIIMRDMGVYIALSMIAWISSFALPPGLLLAAARALCYDVAALACSCLSAC